MDKFDVNLNINWTLLTEFSLDLARDRLDDADANLRCVAKAVIDLDKVTKETRQSALESERTKIPTDMSPYLDFWFGDAIDAAEHIMAGEYSDDDKSLARCIIDQSKSVEKTRVSFLTEQKRAEEFWAEKKKMDKNAAMRDYLKRKKGKPEDN